MYRLKNISFTKYYNRYMDASFHLQKLGQALKAMRTHRGLTQAALAGLAGVTRLKVIAMEAGRSSVAMESYARLAGALGAELTLSPRTRPTLDELKDFQ
jgi:transcriptional regulator with XRE-family HTH domain